jgi:cell division inhibitor SepF
MAGAMRKMAVYLGLVEDDRYERYETYTDDYAYDDDVQRPGEERPVAVQDAQADHDHRGTPYDGSGSHHDPASSHVQRGAYNR